MFHWNQRNFTRRSQSRSDTRTHLHVLSLEGLFIFRWAAHSPLGSLPITCIHTCTNICTYIHTHMYKHMYIHTYTRGHTYVHTYIHRCTYINTSHMGRGPRFCVFLCMYICVFVCMYRLARQRGGTHARQLREGGWGGGGVQESRKKHLTLPADGNKWVQYADALHTSSLTHLARAVLGMTIKMLESHKGAFYTQRQKETEETWTSCVSYSLQMAQNPVHKKPSTKKKKRGNV